MPQILDESGQTWIVSEHRDSAIPPRAGLQGVDDLSYATLTFRTPDGRMSRILRRVAPLDWRNRADDILCLWLQVARPFNPRARDTTTDAA